MFFDMLCYVVLVVLCFIDLVSKVDVMLYLGECVKCVDDVSWGIDEVIVVFESGVLGCLDVLVFVLFLEVLCCCVIDMLWGWGVLLYVFVYIEFNVINFVFDVVWCFVGMFVVFY